MECGIGPASQQRQSAEQWRARPRTDQRQNRHTEGSGQQRHRSCPRDTGEQNPNNIKQRHQDEWAFHGSLPVPAQPSDRPQQNQPRDAPGGIDYHIPHTRLSVGNEELMEFIGGSINRDKQERQPRLDPTPRSGIAPHGLPQGAPKQQRQNRVLGQMRAFANKENYCRDFLL